MQDSPKRNKNTLSSMRAILAACLVIFILPVWIGASHLPQVRKNLPVIKPTIPTADRYQSGKVFLEHADILSYAERPLAYASEQYQVLVGNVVFRKNDMYMRCDSAYFYENTNSFDAFSNVRMEQGDTLFVFADELNYDGETELAVLYADFGKKVRLINRDVKLETDVFNYDMAQEVGYYDVGGVLTDAQNRLESMLGEYHPDTKYAYFYRNVVLTSLSENDTLHMFTDSLIYNTDTHTAELISPTRIINADGEILSSSGTYNTESGMADLFERSTVLTRRGNTLTGDTLLYNRDLGFGEAFGNMILTDSVRQTSILGNYGYYNDNADSAFVTGRALVKEYSKGDTLYLHGDTINAYVDPSDSTRITNVFHRVRIYRSDIQGICDSLSSLERDSMLYMYHHPIIWSDERQIFGNEIHVHFNDSAVDRAYLPENGFMAEHIDEDCYQQLSGAQMTAWFNDSTIRRLYVEGNVMLIMFPMENDSTYNKFAYVESSYMDSYYKGMELDTVRFWPNTTAKVTPLYLAKRNSYFLPKFKWFEDLRPVSPADVFEVPQAMIDLMNTVEPVQPSKKSARAKKKGPEPLKDEAPPSKDAAPPLKDEATVQTDDGDDIDAADSEEEVKL